MAAVRKVISFTDIDGNPVTEEWWFQLGLTDAMEMDFFHEGDPGKYFMEIVQNQNSRQLLKVWRDLLFASVGVRKEIDGRKILVKNDEVRERFQHGGAYEQFFSEIIESDDAGASFFQDILPEELKKKAAEQAELPKSYTDHELLDMSDEEFYAAAGTSDLKLMDKRFTTLAMRRLSNSKANAA